MYKISVIIPIYGVEKFISRCATSLLSQTLSEIQYIFVNDCTPDNSISILNDVITNFPEKAKDITIINHPRNLGLSAARQSGVNIAKGEYIAHCDSDDWVDKDMYRLLYEYAKKGNYDYVKCAHIVTDNSTYHVVKKPKFSKVNIQKNDVISSLISCNGWNSVWDSIAKRELYTINIRFAPCSMLEDFFLSTQLLINAQNIYYLDQPLYYYYQNPESICGKKDITSVKRRALEAKKNILQIEEFIINEYGTNSFKKEMVALKYIPYKLLFPIVDIMDYTCWNSLFNEIKWRIVSCPYISLKNKILFYLAEFHMLSVFKRIYNN